MDGESSIGREKMSYFAHHRETSSAAKAATVSEFCQNPL
jgi:hypothetical protein